MPLTEKHAEILLSICTEWNKAEEDIKFAELVCSDVVIPAVKELRYAGRRIVDAVQSMSIDGGEEDAKSYLNDAKFDCYRARHDSIDVATAKMAKDIEVMVTKIKYEAILKAYPSFPELYSELGIVRTKIAKSRGKRQDRELVYSAIENTDFPKLVERFQKLRACEPMMINLAKADRREKLIGRILTVISIIIAIIALFKDYITQQLSKFT